MVNIDFLLVVVISYTKREQVYYFVLLNEIFLLAREILFENWTFVETVQASCYVATHFIMDLAFLI